MSELKADELEHIAYMQTLEIQSLNARIAELEELVDKLIEVGGEMSDQSYWHEIKWQALVKDWKEREE